MRPDNPNFRPCYRYGMTVVGPGWEQILVDLDHEFVMITGQGTSEHNKIRILQIKEKFGGLRVYYDPRTLQEGREEKAYQALCAKLGEAVLEAERRSFRTCEKCGSEDGTETRNPEGQKFGRVLTLCAKCHAKRDNLPEGQWFELGNGDKTA